MIPTAEATGRLSADAVERYREQGFLHVPGVLSAEEIGAALRAADELLDAEDPQIWGESEQSVQNLYVEAGWRKHPALRHLALHPMLTAIAEQLAGAPLRLYGTDVLRKDPEVHLPTVVHDDEPGLPLDGLSRTLTAWIPLVDVPVEGGCLSYVPGSHRRPPEHRQVHLASFADYRAMDDIWPEYPFRPRIAVPARVGDVLLHDFRTVHMAGSNQSDARRMAFTVVYIDADARYRPGVQDHPVAHLAPGEPVTGDDFPLIRGGAAR